MFQDLLVNGDKGWFNVRLKNIRELQKRLNKSANNQLDKSVASDNSLEEAATEDILFLKSLVVSEENMHIFLQKLNSTRTHRQKMLLNKEINLKEQFPYFFTNPQLVKYLAIF